MTHKAGKKQSKGSNGTGSTVTLYFDVSDPAERKALNGARLLATKHGRRKQAIVALLEAIYTHYEATGELMSASTITGALMGQGTSAMHSLDNLTTETVLPPKPRRAHQSKGGVELTPSAGKASAETVAKNFLTSMKSLASGFFD